MTSDYLPEPIIDQSGEFRGSRSTVPAEVRAEVIRLVSAGELHRADIARRTGVAPATVSRIAAAAALGFSDHHTRKATMARMRLLQARRLEQSEHLHLGLDQAIALAAYRMATRPEDARGISEATRAVRDMASAYRDQVSIDAASLIRSAGIDEALEYLGSIDEAVEHGEPDERGVITIHPPEVQAEDEAELPAPPEPPPGWSDPTPGPPGERECPAPHRRRARNDAPWRSSMMDSTGDVPEITEAGVAQRSWALVGAYLARDYDAVNLLVEALDDLTRADLAAIIQAQAAALAASLDRSHPGRRPALIDTVRGLAIEAALREYRP